MYIARGQWQPATGKFLHPLPKDHHCLLSTLNSYLSHYCQLILNQYLLSTEFDLRMQDMAFPGSYKISNFCGDRSMPPDPCEEELGLVETPGIV